MLMMMMMMMMMMMIVMMMASSWLETSTWWRAGTETTTLEFGKLSNQAPSVKAGLMARATGLSSNCWGNRGD